MVHGSSTSRLPVQRQHRAVHEVSIVVPRLSESRLTRCGLLDPFLDDEGRLSRVERLVRQRLQRRVLEAQEDWLLSLSKEDGVAGQVKQLDGRLVHEADARSGKETELLVRRQLDEGGRVQQILTSGVEEQQLRSPVLEDLSLRSRRQEDQGLLIGDLSQWLREQQRRGGRRRRVLAQRREEKGVRGDRRRQGHPHERGRREGMQERTATPDSRGKHVEGRRGVGGRRQGGRQREARGAGAAQADAGAAASHARRQQVIRSFMLPSSPILADQASRSLAHVDTMTSSSGDGGDSSAGFGSRSFVHSVTSADGLSSLFSATAAPEEMDGVARLRALYPFADVSDLPRAWSAKDKANFISLSENNLKVHYKGVGKGHKDAAAVRATHPIPVSCLLYYFEIRIISKGRDGYMGIGLSAHNVNMQRLPGWDKQSYGYHGDDGHSFCSSGTGVPYGPTFTTGDVIGCGYNLVENTCFYTKNGLNLGCAFRDLPRLPLFATVGLQTPGEEVEANFGMEPFIYDIEDDMKALRQRITDSVVQFPVKYNEWQATLHRLVQTWLIHNGYCSTAEVFSAATRQPFTENVQDIRRRHRIQKLVLAGRIGEAISQTEHLYPHVLEESPNLMFALKCRQFIEMIREADVASAVAKTPFAFTDSSSSCKSPASHASSLQAVSSPSNGLYHHADLSSNSNDCNGNGSANGDDSEMDEGDRRLRGSSEGHAPPTLEDILSFGKDLQLLSQKLNRNSDSYEGNIKMMNEAFSLLAYPQPEKSPIGWLLSPSEREVVCQQLNNAIVLNSLGECNPRPPLEEIIRHSKHLIRLNGQSGAWLVDQI